MGIKSKEEIISWFVSKVGALLAEYGTGLSEFDRAMGEIREMNQIIFRLSPEQLADYDAKVGPLAPQIKAEIQRQIGKTVIIGPAH